MSDTPMTDEVIARMFVPVGDTGAALECWDEMAEHAKSLERDRADLLEVLEFAQSLRPALLVQIGYVPERVLDFCNKARAVVAKATNVVTKATA